MAFVNKCLALLLAGAALCAAADKEKSVFQPGPAASYPAHLTVSNVTIAAAPFETDEQARPAFGKNNPYKYGILPVLIVIQNDSNETLNLEGMKVEFVGPDRVHLDAIPADEVRYVSGGNKPGVMSGPLPTGPKIRRRKNPLDSWEIEGRAFSARMLPPKQSASGFFYFQTGIRSNSQVYVTGLREARTSKELFFFEIPLQR
ncbi:MAG: hypothetical protein IT158_06240 [Bryobacterales bacterium]|nr:hypothetical protein [Bryobacterales bacterium]